MLKGLVDIGSTCTLPKAIISHLENRIDGLGLEESVVLLWCVSKKDRKGKVELIAKIFKRVN